MQTSTADSGSGQRTQKPMTAPIWYAISNIPVNCPRIAFGDCSAMYDGTTAVIPVQGTTVTR
jgi:hypothetical protein